MLNYKRSGTGPTIILIHGLFGSLENLGMVRRGLQSNFDVISIDLPDHGESPHSTQFCFQQYSTAVIELMDSLSLKAVILVGHSLGGKVAMQTALKNPQRISALIVADIAPVSYPPRHNEIFAGLNAVTLNQVKDRHSADRMMEPFIADNGIRQFLLRGLYQQDNQWQWRFNLNLLQRDYDQLSKGIEHHTPFTAPTLFIKGGLSDYLTAEHRPVIRKLFPSSKARIIEDTGHWLHAEKPKIFNQIICQFLDKLEADQ